MEDMKITFDNPQAAYYGGQNVIGSLTVSLSKEEHIRGIELTYKGEANVQWSEGMGDDKKWYYAKETYFKTSTFVLGGQTGELTVQPGQYIYPFNLLLPTHLPSSFEGGVGHVRYTVKGAIVLPWQFNHVREAAFTVLSHLDLNAEPYLQEPFQLAAENNLCCSSRSVSVVASVPCRGFVPGQKCNVTIEVDNRTDKIVPVKCCLVQCNTFEDNSKLWSTKTHVEVYEQSIGAVEEYKSRTWTTDMEIPILPPSYLNHCSFIHVSYNIKVKGVISGLHRNAAVEIPVVIGTIPYRNYFSSVAPPTADMPVLSETPSAPLEADSEQVHVPSTLQNPYFNYPELPPPTYEECVSGKTDNRR